MAFLGAAGPAPRRLTVPTRRWPVGGRGHPARGRRVAACGPGLVTVYLVGAGPGDPGLLTVRGAERARRSRRGGLRPARRWRRCWTSHRTAPSASTSASRRDGPPSHRRRSTSCWCDHGRSGRTVVRLKGGDPFVFARGGEEAAALAGGRRGLRGRPRASPRRSPRPPTPASRSRSATRPPPSPSSPATRTRQAPRRPQHRAGDGSVDWEAVARVGGHDRGPDGGGPLATHRAAPVDGGLSPDTPAAAVQLGYPSRAAHRPRHAVHPGRPPVGRAIGDRGRECRRRGARLVRATPAVRDERGGHPGRGQSGGIVGATSGPGRGGRPRRPAIASTRPTTAAPAGAAAHLTAGRTMGGW